MSEGKATKPQVTKLYAAVAFRDEGGEHEKGTEITLPYETPEQQAEVDNMIRYGVLTKTKPSST